ncbi:MAG TPA: hypothetical protein CFH84_11475 [Sulfurimonas sp. UBA12504]|nr:MAG: hypothetical protein A2019_03635 [Sulfurimonas sp. GWF2_37_8]DAB29079.1 MAG TPA: hypothetical protein CFH84_11475 [Sulfurimonas sp. UBA12504]
MGLDEVFKVLSKGVLLSINSQKQSDEAKFLMVEENFDELSRIMKQLGFILNGENGYFYLSKKEKMNDVELQAFLNNHKNILLCIAILKQLFPYLESGTVLKQTDFIVQLKQKEDSLLEQKFEYIFKTQDLMESVERFFDLLEKNHILEKKESDSKDAYLVLRALEYYVKIVQSTVA